MSVLDAFAVAGMLVLARVSGFVLMVPGLSSARIAMPVKAMLVAGLSLALTPLVAGRFAFPDAFAPALVVGELATGLALGALARLFFAAIAFSGSALSSFIGLTAPPGLTLDIDETLGPLATLIVAAATALVFASGLHRMLIGALVDSYTVVAPGAMIEPAPAFQQAVTVLGEAFATGLRLSMPFLIYGVIVNGAIGLANRMAAQVPIYFVSMPFVVGGGLVLLVTLADSHVALFVDAFAVMVSAVLR